MPGIRGLQGLSMAQHANAMAAKLASGITSAGHALAADTETNQVFPILPDPTATP
jgi:threonine aldolase